MFLPLTFGSVRLPGSVAGGGGGGGVEGVDLIVDRLTNKCSGKV